MMVFAGHIGVALIFAYAFNLSPLLAALGGILPDLDIIFYPIGKKWAVIHRKLTHSLVLPLTLFIFSFNIPRLLPVAIGVIIHLVTDLDSWGVPLFFPFITKEYSLFKVDHKMEHVGPVDFIKEWFKNRDLKFWFEWLLLIVGFLLNYNYFVGLLRLFGII